MHDAAALVSVHGADCMNLMFLPPHGVIVEIDPVHYGALARSHQRVHPLRLQSTQTQCTQATGYIVPFHDAIFSHG